MLHFVLLDVASGKPEKINLASRKVLQVQINLSLADVTSAGPELLNRTPHTCTKSNAAENVSTFAENAKVSKQVASEILRKNIFAENIKPGKTFKVKTEGLPLCVKLLHSVKKKDTDLRILVLTS